MKLELENLQEHAMLPSQVQLELRVLEGTSFSQSLESGADVARQVWAMYLALIFRGLLTASRF
jgi:hypothetical protein